MSAVQHKHVHVCNTLLVSTLKWLHSFPNLNLYPKHIPLLILTSHTLSLEGKCSSSCWNKARLTHDEHHGKSMCCGMGSEMSSLSLACHGSDSRTLALNRRALWSRANSVSSTKLHEEKGQHVMMTRAGVLLGSGKELTHTGPCVLFPDCLDPAETGYSWHYSECDWIWLSCQVHI